MTFAIIPAAEALLEYAAPTAVAYVANQYSDSKLQTAVNNALDVENIDIALDIQNFMETPNLFNIATGASDIAKIYFANAINANRMDALPQMKWDTSNNITDGGDQELIKNFNTTITQLDPRSFKWNPTTTGFEPKDFSASTSLQIHTVAPFIENATMEVDEYEAKAILSTNAFPIRDFKPYDYDKFSITINNRDCIDNKTDLPIELLKVIINDNQPSEVTVQTYDGPREAITLNKVDKLLQENNLNFRDVTGSTKDSDGYSIIYTYSPKNNPTP